MQRPVQLQTWPQQLWFRALEHRLSSGGAGLASWHVGLLSRQDWNPCLLYCQALPGCRQQPLDDTFNRKIQLCITEKLKLCQAETKFLPSYLNLHLTLLFSVLSQRTVHTPLPGFLFINSLGLSSSTHILESCCVYTVRILSWSAAGILGNSLNP